MRAANNLGHLLSYDDHVGALEACRSAMEQANRLGDVRFIGSFTWAVAAYLDRDGRFDEGRALRAEVQDRVELPASSRRWYELTDLTARVERGDAAAEDPAYYAVSQSVDDANPQSRAAVSMAKATLNLLTGKLEAAYDNAMSVDDELRLPEHLAVAAEAAALLRDSHRLEVVAEAIESGPARGRMVGSIRSEVAAALAAASGRTDEAVAGFSRALEFGYLRLDRAKLQALFATLVGRDVPAARKASDAAFDVFTEVGANSYLRLYSAGMPAAGEQQVAGG
jgi:hypothetical protein